MTRMSPTRAYNLLNVEIGGDHDAIKLAFRRIVKQLHPDAGSPSPQAFIDVKAAYDFLRSLSAQQLRILRPVVTSRAMGGPFSDTQVGKMPFSTQHAEGGEHTTSRATEQPRSRDRVDPGERRGRTRAHRSPVREPAPPKPIFTSPRPVFAASHALRPSVSRPPPGTPRWHVRPMNWRAHVKEGLREAVAYADNPDSASMPEIRAVRILLPAGAYQWVSYRLQSESGEVVFSI